MFRFMITFASYLRMGKALRWGGGIPQNVGPNLVTKFRLIQSSLHWECLTPTLGLYTTPKKKMFLMSNLPSPHKCHTYIIYTTKPTTLGYMMPTIYRERESMSYSNFFFPPPPSFLYFSMHHHNHDSLKHL